jgi:hypothetical protein
MALDIASDQDTPAGLWASLDDGTLQFAVSASLPDPIVGANDALTRITAPNDSMVLHVSFTATGDGKIYKPPGSDVGACSVGVVVCDRIRPPPDPAPAPPPNPPTTGLFMMGRSVDVLAGGAIDFQANEQAAQASISANGPTDNQVYWMMNVLGSWIYDSTGTLVQTVPSLIGQVVTIAVNPPP